MTVNETFNIHKKINCIFPSFKSKFLCRKGFHNYEVNRLGVWKCHCCGKEAPITWIEKKK